MKFFLLYIDPGSGSMLLQAIIAGCLAVLFFFKRIGFMVKSLFRRKKQDNSNSASGL